MSEALEPRRRTSPGVMAAIAVAVLLLAVIGATAGYVAAGDPRNTAGGVESTPPVTTAPASDGPATPATPATPTTEPTTGPTASQAPGGFALPDLVNQDFQDARRKVRELGLGWRLMFGPSGDDKTIGSTKPAPDATVKRGDTVTLYVRGRAPEATVPGVVGLSCSQAARIIVDQGLYPLYPGPAGRNGTVYQQEPEAGGATVLKWNDQMKIYCSTATASPSAAP